MSSASGLSDSGFGGPGVFVDWSPGGRPGRKDVVRLGYLPQRRPGDGGLPVSDGQDRLFLETDWTILGRAWRTARIGLRVDSEYGRAFEIQKPYFRADATLAPQLAAVRSRRWSLDLAGTAGFRVATDARENGTIFHNRRSTQGHAGLELRFGLGTLGRSQIGLEGARDFASRNALSGWRVGLAFRQLIGAGSPR